MLSEGRSREFGRRREPHRIIITHGDTVQDFIVRPWVVSGLAFFGILFSIMYLSATAYLVFRDDILSYSRAEQAQMQSKYEDRIAQLRSQIDRIASRQMLDQQALESHVQKLMQKQADFEAYSSVLDPIINKAREAGLPIRSELKVPLPKTAPWRTKEKQAAAPMAKPEASPNLALAYAGTAVAHAPVSAEAISSRFEELTRLGFRSSKSFTDSAAASTQTPQDSAPLLQTDETTALAYNEEETPSIFDATEVSSEDDKTILKLADATDRLEQEMIDSKVILHNLLNDLRYKSDRVEKRIASLGIRVDVPAENAAVGGPYIPISDEYNHDQLAEDAEKVEIALDRFVQLKNQVKKLPISHPLPSGRLSSKFGIRKDPFLNRMSMHSGIDVADRYGNSIRAAGIGTVTYAGPRSGYGIMVEVDHGNGVVSRYAHMSKALAKKGEHVNTGTIIGKVGSTGRSTGPHLHFETRVRGKAVNPYSFLIAGKELHKLI
ncbi:Peptidase family M23 [Cohaesibacter marisflavi]|uniref:Peptidase family M23 n=1 Tax=Cohaesibacter marisflavi TaxID=655353 RepID=A0A1I5FSB5_9HYPH|nr:M23 family metallopeptidase [Cohaesibacter marisflavi]SFO26657.1 Peptidase family M23 [Cohaesibacter marisflavi]